MKTEPTNNVKQLVNTTNLLEKTVQKTNREKFFEGFKKLADENITQVAYNAFGVITIDFKDGGSCGGLVPWFESGFISRTKYEATYRI